MPDEVKVTIAKLQKAARYVDDLCDKVEAIRATVTSDVESLGEPWGDDTYGEKFAPTYVPNRDDLLYSSGDGKPGALPGLVKRSAEISHALAKSANYLQAMEDRNAAQFERRP